MKFTSARLEISFVGLKKRNSLANLILGSHTLGNLCSLSSYQVVEVVLQHPEVFILERVSKSF